MSPSQAYPVGAIKTYARSSLRPDRPLRSTKMERIHKIGISIGLLALAFVALYRFLPVKETHYTAEATVELIRVEPASVDESKEEKVIDEESNDHSAPEKQAKVEQ